MGLEMGTVAAKDIGLPASKLASPVIARHNLMTLAQIELANDHSFSLECSPVG